ncbi:succinate dehydrogenase assembly factor 2-B, mitochondrial-like [Teleopsis dalmanni]|uniref:succinate dehydrogenase assembly factor 2-B, mitochondrial-like n=1 Tax=Teleopsis dalmanni TaxID=139649 RepID=UPI0018CC9FC6|nr:succinate dehydrogenase assembly factor 2-B, mitochondrial-like [Teleopsis dalmanni]XP_037935010.1 succinate dehydrogenase assembly factor 2-B, mitochondrial-like [Teleopsis dalmanni]
MLRKVCCSRYSGGILPYLLGKQNFSSAAGPTGSQPPKKEVLNHADVPIIDYEDPDYLPLPEYPMRPDEPLEVRKQRLVYQSRKRGMLENDLLLSTFVAKYLKDMDAKLTLQYDQLINGVSNDWDIYYWATQVKPTPPEHDNEIMRMLKKHVANEQCDKRLRQPDL